MEIELGIGERGLLVGQTGSGKTTAAIYHMIRTAQTPVIVLDSKYEPAFDGLAGDGERLAVVESHEEFISVLFSDERPEFIVARPSSEEVSNPEILDAYLSTAYSVPGAFVYVDEAYQVHKGAKPGPGLISLLTRGRSRGITTLISTQRPSWLSRFALTEAGRFYIYRLIDKRDRKTLGEIMPGFEDLPVAEKFYFYYHKTGHDTIDLLPPLPIIERKQPALIEPITQPSTDWI